MFIRSLSALTLASEPADRMFPHISGWRFGNGDETMTATLRALLPSRMGEGDHIKTIMKNSTESETTIKKFSPRDFFDMMLLGNPDPNCLYIVGFSGTEGGTDAAFAHAKTFFVGAYEEQKDIAAYLEKSGHKVRIYVNKEIKTTLVFVGGLNTSTWHLVQSFVSRLLPWYFETKKLTDEEKKLCVSLTQRSSDEYQRLIEEFAQQYDFRSEAIRAMVADISRKANEKILNNVKREIRNAEEYANDYLDKYYDYMRTLQDLRAKESGLYYNMENAESDSTLAEFLICNKNVDLLNTDDGVIRMIIRTTIDNYDINQYESYTANPNSYLFKGYDVGESVFESHEARKKFLDAIFIDERAKIKVCAFFEIAAGGHLNGNRDYRYPEKYRDYLVNPHFKIFLCFGNNERYIRDALTKGDYIAAINQLISTAKNLNLAETRQTVAPFLGWVFNSGNKIIQMKDGRSLTPVEAYHELFDEHEEEKK